MRAHARACVCMLLFEHACKRVPALLCLINTGEGARARACVRADRWASKRLHFFIAPFVALCIVHCVIRCSAAAMPFARASNCSVAAWRTKDMVVLCRATTVGFLWQPSVACVIVLRIATVYASERIGARTNMTALLGFSCRKRVSLSWQCAGFARMQGCIGRLRERSAAR